jgi:hypothetical protein
MSAREYLRNHPGLPGPRSVLDRDRATVSISLGCGQSLHRTELQPNFGLDLRSSKSVRIVESEEKLHFIDIIEREKFTCFLLLIEFAQVADVPSSRNSFSCHVLQLVRSSSNHFLHLVWSFPIRAEFVTQSLDLPEDEVVLLE